MAAGACLTMLPSTAAAKTETITGRVVRVADGDTVTLVTRQNRKVRVRINGIDAPETRQAYGDRAKQTLRRMADGRQATVHAYKQDRYGRYVGKLMVGSTDCAAVMLERGMAWYFRRYEEDVPKTERKTYEQLEARARRAKRGLWSQTNPMAPWDWRKLNKARQK